LAVEIAALLAAADLLVINHEPPSAEYIRETTDSWNASIERKNDLTPDIADQVILLWDFFICLF
jgi:glucoamylase